MKKALILVDIQNDFCPNGALAVDDGDKIIPVVNSIMDKFEYVIATQDWHPSEHISFASNNNKSIGELIELNGQNQVMWPNHCVQNTKGAEFVDSLNRSKITKVFQKGTDVNVDSYSGFFNNDHKSETGLNNYLKTQGIEELYITGLATDYCVKYTVIDALNLGYKVNLVIDAVRGVNLNPNDVENSIKEMENSGAKIIKSSEI
ncbi:MAG: bifunctional nicotinamidase/pyrazinamidase [Candidatus Sericytochromatia bacterium]